MTGRHRLADGGQRVVVRPARPVEVVEAVTELAHRVAFDEMVRHHRDGRYVAECGREITPHSMVAAPRAQCPLCWVPRQRRSSR